jgi:hypothetical protein
MIPDSKSGQFKVRTLLSKNPQFWPLISGMSGDLNLHVVSTGFELDFHTPLPKLVASEKKLSGFVVGHDNLLIACLKIAFHN